VADGVDRVETPIHRGLISSCEAGERVEQHARPFATRRAA